MTGVSPRAIAFQNDIDQLLAEPPPVGLRLWPMIAALFLAALVAAGALSRVDVVIVAPGRLMADSPPLVLKPVSGAILQELLVRPGDVVAAGDLLARLDPTLPAADRAALEAERAALAAEIARIEAELAQTVLQDDSPDGRMQQDVQKGRAALDLVQRESMAAQVSGIEAGLAAEAAQGQGLADRLAVAREIEAMRSELALRNSGTHLAVLEARVLRLDAEAQERAHLARLADLSQRLASARAGFDAFGLDQRRQLLEALAKARPRLAIVQENLAKARLLSAQSELRAPRPGVVLSVAASGPGSLMGTGDAVVTLVPGDVPLIAEIGLRSADVGSVATGDLVALKIDAFPWRRHGTLRGELADVGHASVTPPGAVAALHASHIRIEAGAALANLPPGIELLPGMTLSAEIRTGTRSILDYFLEPLLRGLKESLREP